MSTDTLPEARIAPPPLSSASNGTVATVFVNSIRGLRLAIWAALSVWVFIVLAMWAMMKPESAIHQCVNASQSAALMIAGYLVTRSLTSVLSEGAQFFHNKR
jgi:hypothetical protein